MIRLTPEGPSAPVLNLERERADSMTLVLMHCGDIRPSRRLQVLKWSDVLVGTPGSVLLYGGLLSHKPSER